MTGVQEQEAEASLEYGQEAEASLEFGQEGAQEVSG